MYRIYRDRMFYSSAAAGKSDYRTQMTPKSARTGIIETQDPNYIMKVYYPGMGFTLRSHVAGRESFGDMSFGRAAEVIAGKSVCHPNVEQFLGGRLIEVSIPRPDKFANTPRFLPAFLMEQRKSLLSTRKFKLDKNLRKCLRQVAEGIAAIHRAGWIHGDITANNIMVDKKLSRPLIIGLGNASFGPLGSTELNRVGNPLYDAPEVQKHGYHSPNERMVRFGSAAVSKKIDVWQFGMLVSQCISGAIGHGSMHEDVPPPFMSKTEFEEYHEAVKKKHKFVERIRKQFSGPGQHPLLTGKASKIEEEIAKYPLNEEPEYLLNKIWGISDAFSGRLSKHITKNTGLGESNDWVKFVKFCLAVDPAKRPTMDEVLQHPFWSQVLPDTAIQHNPAASSSSSASAENENGINNGEEEDDEDEDETAENDNGNNSSTTTVVALPQNHSSSNVYHPFRNLPTTIEEIRPLFLQEFPFYGGKLSGILRVMNSQNQTHADENEARLALAMWLALRTVHAIPKLEARYNIWAHVDIARRNVSIFRACCRLLFDCFQLGPEKFSNIDRRTQETKLSSSSGHYQSVIESESIILALAASDFQGIYSEQTPSESLL